MPNRNRLMGQLILLVFATQLLAATAAGQIYNVVQFFTSDGASPGAGLIRGTDGNFYGTTGNGGTNDYGTIFKINTSSITTTLTTLHNFSGGDGAGPGGLIQGRDGNLYGTTGAGGGIGCESGCGTIFRIGTDGSAFSVLHSFSGNDGAGPEASLIQGADGSLYGTASTGGASGYGTIFNLHTDGTAFTTLHNFARSDGGYPLGALIRATDGNLYGTTSIGGASGFGTIFKIYAEGTGFLTLHSFASGEGEYPSSALMQASDGNLYGTTSAGGTSQDGTIFTIHSDGTGFATLYSFCAICDYDGYDPLASLIQGADGNLYGTTYRGGRRGDGTIFRIQTSGAGYATLRSFSGSDGASPTAALIQANGSFYGTTPSGGASGNGTVFMVDTSGMTLATLHNFAYIHGSNPYASLIQGTDGNFYGTTYLGGANGAGAIFRIAAVNVGSAVLTTLHSFASGEGQYPTAPLLQATDGYLYGTTYLGGANGDGTIFKVRTDGAGFTTLHSFAYTDGAFPQAGLIQGPDGNLYGTTAGGASCSVSCGTIFKIDTNGMTLTTLHRFDYFDDGSNPLGGLIQSADGNLYGTTPTGGASGMCPPAPACGTLFKIDPNGATFTTLHRFDYYDGASPYASLMQGTDGSLYGTTADGGSGYGTIFKINTSGAGFATLHDFVKSDGATPFGALIQRADGSLYGTTQAGGAYNDGTIFRIDTGGTTLTTLHGFSGGDGAHPLAGLIQATDGNLYGTASSGGPGLTGAVFRLIPNF